MTHVRDALQAAGYRVSVPEDGADALGFALDVDVAVYKRHEVQGGEHDGWWLLVQAAGEKAYACECWTYEDVQRHAAAALLEHQRQGAA